jgi:LCP family protein required for cell wall assembly
MKSDRFQFDRRMVIAAICIAVAIAGVIFVFASRTGRQMVGPGIARLAMGDQPMNVLLIANNARDVAADDPLGLGTAAGQADVILLAHLDPAAHTIYAITIPRDALVAQPHFQDSVPKIKTLFFMGDEETPPRGPQYLETAVADLTGLRIDGYIAMNFTGFEKAVDLVGGLTIDVKARIYDPQNSHADFQPGVQHIDGAQALAFIRVRQNEAGNSYRVDDYQRMQAEVEVLGLLRNKLLDPLHASSIIPGFADHIRKDVATDIPQSRLISLGIAMAGAPVFQVPIGSISDSMVLAPAAIAGINRRGRIDEAEYDVLDPAQVQKQLAQFGSKASRTGLPSSPRPDSVRILLYGSAHLALHLAHLGFRHVDRAGGSTGSDEIVYPAAHPELGWLVARAVGTGNSYVVPGDVDEVVVKE